MTDDRSRRNDVPQYEEKEPNLVKNPGMKQMWQHLSYQPEQDLREEGGFSHISKDQFQNMVDGHPETQALQTIHQFKNHLIFLHNTLTGLPLTSAGIRTLMPTATVLADYDTILQGHMEGMHDKVARTLSAAHGMFKQTMTEPSINQKAFLESPTGIHLQDITHNILPNTIAKYKELMELGE